MPENVSSRSRQEDGRTVAPKVQFVVIDEGSEGQRIDNYLSKVLKGVPRSRIYRMVREGEVRVNKGRVTLEHRLELGQIVRIPPVHVSTTTSPSAPKLSAEQVPILFENEALMAVNKPVGMAVHGGSGVSHGVIERLRASRPEAKFLELVHRLDRETSGLLLIAKRRAALVHLHEQLRVHSTVKIYYAIVFGAFALRSKRIDLKLLKTTDARGERHVFADERGIEASTVITGLHRFENALGQFTVVRAQLETGRTHQIRVHCAASGFPIVGDPKYGVFELNRKLEKLGARRMFLHAHSFEFFLPNETLPLVVRAPVPTSFTQFSGFSFTS